MISMSFKHSLVCIASAGLICSIRSACNTDGNDRSSQHKDAIEVVKRLKSAFSKESRRYLNLLNHEYSATLPGVKGLVKIG